MLNHSTFNAGNEVVCAGMLSITNAQLTMINNESGHYKPDQKNLFDCVQLRRKDMVSKWCNAMVILGIHGQNGKQVYRFNFNNFPANGVDKGTRLLLAVHCIPLYFGAMINTSLLLYERERQRLRD